MKTRFFEHLREEITKLQEEGLYKSERVITSQQQVDITVGGKEVINLCANNYLGLANAPELIQAGQAGLQKYGYGMASVRFICGTQDVHRECEKRISKFLGVEDTILYSSCFDANGGLFETLLGPEDAVVSDALNHASIIDGVRLCKAQRFRYNNNDMEDLETQLIKADNAGVRYKLIVTDGVFSMDGVVANLQGVCDLAERFNALVMIDDSHAVGVLGKGGRGTHEHCDVMGRIDIITGTLGKALGGASGGYTAGKKEVVDWLRNRSRPYLFSNSLAPMIAAVSINVLDRLESADALRKKLNNNTVYFRQQMQKLGFKMAGNDHPIIPVMLGDAVLAKQFADRMLELGVYVISFSFPVVPRGQARIRTQMSAVHTQMHLDKVISVFKQTGQELGVI